MRRRDWLAELAASALWPAATWAQQGPPPKRVGVRADFSATHIERRHCLSAFSAALTKSSLADRRAGFALRALKNLSPKRNACSR